MNFLHRLLATYPDVAVEAFGILLFLAVAAIGWVVRHNRRLKALVAELRGGGRDNQLDDMAAELLEAAQRLAGGGRLREELTRYLEDRAVQLRAREERHRAEAAALEAERALHVGLREEVAAGAVAQRITAEPSGSALLPPTPQRRSTDQPPPAPNAPAAESLQPPTDH